MSLRIWISLLLLSVLWGGSFFFAKVANGELCPLTVVFARVALAALAIDLVVALTGKSLFRPGMPWPAFIAMGLINNMLPFSLIFWGQTQIASGLASILNATTPLFTLVVAHVTTRDEKITAAKVTALVTGFGGVVVLLGPDLLLGERSALAGQVACLAAALSYAFAGVFGRRFTRMGVAPRDAAAGQITASAVLILPIMLVVDRPWELPALPSLATRSALAALALLSTALAYVLYFDILAVAGPTNLLLVTFLIPVTATGLGALFFGERLEFQQGAGMVLIGLALALLDGRVGRCLRPAK
jgi:drug/metabolite transporter (DMT)-like permease